MNSTRLVVVRPLLATSALLLAVLGGCSMPEEVKPPAQLMSKEKMVSVLVQLHLLEARVEASRLSPDSARALFQSQKAAILWKNNISEGDSILQRSYRYYSINNKDMNEIYKVVIDSLERREAELNGGKPVTPEHPW